MVIWPIKQFVKVVTNVVSVTRINGSAHADGNHGGHHTRHQFWQRVLHRFDMWVSAAWDWAQIVSGGAK